MKLKCNEMKWREGNRNHNEGDRNVMKETGMQAQVLSVPPPPCLLSTPMRSQVAFLAAAKVPLPCRDLQGFRKNIENGRTSENLYPGLRTILLGDQASAAQNL